MTTPDFVMFAFYLALMIGIGLFFSRENTSTKEMFAAGGRSPWWVAGLSGYMTFFSAGAFVVWGGLAYEYGLVAVAINVTHGIAALLVGYFIAGKWKELGVETPSQYIKLRFGSNAVRFYTWTMMSVRIISSAVALYSLAVLASALLPLSEGTIFRDDLTGNLNTSSAIVIFGFVVIAYTMIGGLWAVLMTDVLQFIIILLTVIFTAILMLLNIGGVTPFIERAPNDFFSLTNEEFSLFFLAGWTALHFFQFGAEWAFAQRYISVPRPKDAARSMYLFGVLYVISPILFFAPPMILRAVDPGANPEQAYIKASAMVLPQGMLGMVLAAMFSATASMISSQLNVYAGVLTELVSHRQAGNWLTERTMVSVGRGFTVIIGTAVIGMALIIPKLGGAEAIVFLMMSFIGPLFAPAVWGLLDRRIGRNEIAISITVSIIVALFFKVGLTGPALLSSISFLDGLAIWASSSPRSIDIVYAVLAPVITLSTLSALKLTEQGDSSGWRALTEHQASAESDMIGPSRLPARVVAIALLLAAASITILIPINREYVSSLLIASVVLVGLAGAMAILGWRSNKSA